MQIIINGIVTKVLIGCYTHERDAPQEVVTDLSITLYPFNWLTKDKLDTTVDYDDLIDYVKQCISETYYHLLESLAEDLAIKIIQKYKLIQNLTLKLTKTAICGVKAKQITVSHKCERRFKVALALGSNLSNAPKQQLVTAIEILGEYISDMTLGGFYETKPFGFLEQNNFYNTAVSGYTTLKPEELFGKIKSIEKLMGKEELVKNGPRIIDIDLILVDDLVYQHNFLTIPHVAMHQRDFVLAPLADIVGSWQHPILHKTITELLSELGEEHKFILNKVNSF